MRKEKKTMYIENIEKHVITLKAVGLKPLRLFPGHNLLDGDIKAYTEGNTAAEAIFEASLKIIDPGKVDKEQARKAKEKNDKLNKSAKVLKAVKVELKDKEKALKEAEKNIENMREKMEKMEAMINKLQDKKETPKEYVKKAK